VLQPRRGGYLSTMSTTTLVIVCIVAAVILVGILAMLMLAPTRLREPFSHGYTRRQWDAWRERRQARAERQRRQR
jgi:uncharacterized protein HemY